MLNFSHIVPVVIALIIGLIVGFANLHPSAGAVTVSSQTYVSDGDKKIKVSTDNFRNKETKTRQLNNSN